MPDPAAPTVPSTSPAPAKAPAPAAATLLDPAKPSPFAALDSKAKTVAAPPAAKEPPDPAKPADPGQAPAKPAEDAKPAASKEERTVKDPKWFREQHEKTSAELKASREQIRSMEARIAEAEAKGKDTTVLSDRLGQLEKERDGLRAELRAAKQEVDPAFKEKWDKPFNQTAEYTKNMVEQMSVASEDGASRPAQWTDFVSLYAMPINKAAQAARQMFGEEASLVISQLNELHRMDYSRSAALEEEKARWKENETKEAADYTRRSEGYKGMVEMLGKRLAEENPAFQDPPGEEGKENRELRQEGYAIFDERPATIQDAAYKAAEVRHRVAAHGPLMRKLALTEAKLKEAETTIAELKGNGPGKVRRSGESEGTEPDWRAELRTNVAAQ